eukprot:SAG31_NODE_637_length_13337_cov_23.061867_5_plen_77_part_00
MKRVSEIKQKREERFYKNRMKASKQVQKLHDRRELKEDIDLLGLSRDEKESVKTKIEMKDKLSENAAASSMSISVD